ncbi:MAG: pilus assembly protein PilP [Desulfuromonadales bacterium]
MIRYSLCLVFSVLAFFCLAGCSEQEPAVPSAQTTKAPPPPAQTAAPPPETTKAAVPEETFDYLAEGRRDPFVPLSRIRKALPEERTEPQTPLEKYDVGQFRLIGVIVGKGEPKAMVVAPDGKSYILAEGLRIGKNSGVIVKISSEAIVVNEKYYDFSGNVIENVQKITVPNREGV